MFTPNIISCETKLENVYSLRGFKKLFFIVGCKIHGEELLEARESKNSLDHQYLLISIIILNIINIEVT